MGVVRDRLWKWWRAIGGDRESVHTPSTPMAGAPWPKFVPLDTIRDELGAMARRMVKVDPDFAYRHLAWPFERYVGEARRVVVDGSAYAVVTPADYGTYDDRRPARDADEALFIMIHEAADACVREHGLPPEKERELRDRLLEAARPGWAARPWR